MIQKQTQNVKIPLLYVVCILLFSFTALAAPMTQIYVGQDPYNNNPVSYSLTIYGMLWNFDAIGVQACQIDWGAGNGWEYISKGVNNQQYVVSHTYAKGDLGEKVIRYRCQDVNGAWSLGNTQYTHYDVIVLEDVTPPAVSIYLGEEPLVHNEYVYTSRVYANLWNNESQTFVNACEINWGDGSGWKSVQTGNENQWYSVSYDYTTPGEKTVQYRCRNTVGLWSFGNELHRDFSVITIDESAFCVDNHQATVDIISLTPTRGVLRVSDLDDTSAQLYVQLYESDYETLCADIGYVAQGQDIEFTHTCPRGEVFGLVYGVDSCGQTQSPVWKGSANRPNAPPTLDAIPDQFVNEGETLTVTLVGSDPDGDSLTYSRVSGVGSVSGNVYTFIAPFYPGQSDTVHDVTVRVRDGFGGSAERTFRITVKNVNRPPVLEAIPDQVVNEGETLTVTLVGSDPDGDSLTYSRVSGVGSVSGNVYTFTAPFYAGQSDTVHDVTVRVRDGFGGSAERTFRITVKNVNRAPVLDDITHKEVEEESTLSFVVTASDPDGDSLVFSAQNLPVGSQFNTQTQEFSWTPRLGDRGMYDVIFMVTDGELVDEAVVRITVLPLSDPEPVASIMSPAHDSEFDDSQEISFVGIATGTGPLLYNWTSSRDGLLRSGVHEGSSLASSFNSALSIGMHSITFSVSDAYGRTVSDIISISVVPACAPSIVEEAVSVWFNVTDCRADDTVLQNREMRRYDANSCGTFADEFFTIQRTVTCDYENENAPRLDAIGDKEVRVGETLSFLVTAVDPQNRALTYSASSLPQGVSFSSSGSFSWTPSYVQIGSYQVTFSVTNGLFTDSDTIAITVLPPLDDAPVASITSPIDGATFIVDQEIIFTGVGDKGSIESFEWTSSLDGLLHDGVGNFSTFTTSDLSVGQHIIIFRVYDVYGRSASDSVSVRVRELHEPVASITSPLDGDSFREGDSILISGSAVDTDGTIEEYSFYSSRDGLLYSGTCGTSECVKSFSLTNLSVGVHTLTFSVLDNDGLSADSSITFTVRQAASPIVSIVSPRSDDRFKENALIDFIGSASDSEGVIESVSWFSNRDGFLSSEMSFTGSDLSLGKHVVTFSATNDAGVLSETSVSIEIKPLLAPTATIINPRNGQEFKLGDDVFFEGNASDPDGIIVSYQWSSSLDGILEEGECNTQTCHFTFVRNDLSLGRHDITLTVMDDDVLKYTDTDTIWIVINPLLSPKVTIHSPVYGGTYSADELILFNGTAVDPDGVVVEYSWIVSSIGTLRSGAGEPVSFTEKLPVGEYSLTLRAVDDDGQVGQDYVEFSVVPACAPSIVEEAVSAWFNVTDCRADDTVLQNREMRRFDENQCGTFEDEFFIIERAIPCDYELENAPRLDAIGDKEVRVGEELTFIVSAIDPSDRTLTYSAEPFQSGMSFDESSGAFNWSPALSQVGIYTVTFSVTNGLFTDSETITITVLPPVEDDPFASIISPADGSIFENTSEISFVGNASGAQLVSYNWTSSRDGLLFDDGFYDGSQLVSSFDSTLSIGMHIITFSVSDVYGRIASDTINISVIEACVPSIVEEAVSDWYNVSECRADDTVLQNRDMRRYDENQCGTFEDEFFTIERSVSCDYERENAPILDAIGDKEVHVGEELSFTVSAVDPQGRELTYSAEPLQPGMIFDASTGLFSWSPELSQEGSYTVTFSVTNGLFTDSETITITVLPPVGPLPTASITSPVDSSTYIVNDEVIFTGIGDGVSITSFEWVSDRDGLLHEGIGNFSTFKSTSLSVGVHDITFTVYDVYGRSASDSIAVRVRELFEPTASITTPTDGDRFKETHTVFVSALVSDSDGVIENYTLYSDKDGVLAQSALGESSATLNFDLMNLSVGRHALSLTVFDDDGLSASDSVYFYVDALTAPVITIVSPLHQDTYKVGEEIIFKAEAYDEDGEVISIEWTSSIDGFIGLGSEFTLHNLSFGKHTVNAVATDNDGLTSTASVVFEVKPLEAPTALIIHPTSGSVFYKDQPITFEGNASDPDGIVTDITWSSSLDGIFHTDYCGLPSCSFIFNYSNLSLGRHDITLTVVDDDVLQYTDTYTVWILINPLEAPMVTITSPDNGAVFGRQELILFTANVTSMHEIVEYTWKTDATGVIANGTGLPQPFTKQFEKGSYVATLIVRDEHGLTSQGTVQFSVVDGEPVPIPEPVVEPFTDVYVSSMRLLNPNERVESGDYAYFTFTFRNRGDISVQDLTVQIAIPELGISRRSRNFELSQDGMVTTTLVLPIPHGVYPGEYLARATLTGENVRRVQHRHVMII